MSPVRIGPGAHGGCSSAWIEHLAVAQVVGSSNLLTHPKLSIIHMRIRRRILKTIAFTLLLLAFFSTWYINKFLAPTYLKNFFIKNISRAIDRPISLEGVHFNFIRGLTLNDLTIYEPDKKTTFVKAGRISTTLLFIPILKEKTIIIPSISISSLKVNVVKNQDNSLNFLNPALVKKSSLAKTEKQKGFSFLVQKIYLENGEITFSDNSKSPAYTKQLTGLDGELVYSTRENTVTLKMTSQLSLPLKTTIGVEGSYSLKDSAVVAKVAIKNLALSEPYDYFYKNLFPLELKDGVTDAILDLKIDKNKKALLSVKSLVKNLDVSGFGLKLKGPMSINAVFNLLPSEPPQLNYKVELSLAGPTLSGVYLLNELSNLNGIIKITNDSISTPALSGYAHNTLIKFTGGINNLKDPNLKLTAEAAVDLANYKNFLPQSMKEPFRDVELEGPAELNINFFDRLKDPQPLLVDGEIKLKGVLLKMPVFKNKFEKIWGAVLFKNDTIYISHTSFEWGTQNYTIDAKIGNLALLPDIKMKLKGKEVFLESRFQILKDNIHFLRLAGRYLNSSFNISGDIWKLENPIFRGRGNLALDLMDLRKLIPAISPGLERFGIRGICNLEINAKGPFNELLASELTVKAHSDVINIWDLKINDINFDLRMKDKYIAVRQFNAMPYNGKLDLSIEIDLNQPNPPYAINLAMAEIDLSRLAFDTDLRKKPISGKALCKVNMRGYGKNLEAMRGEGFIFVKGGYLWEIPLLRGIANLLFMPNLSSIIFDEATCHFAIANKAISSADLKFHSQNVSLLAEGSVYFDGTLDFLVTTSVSESLLKGTSEFERLAGTLLAEAGRFMGRIKIGGTIKKPEYKFIPFPIDQLLRDKLKGLLGGFF